MAIRKIGIVSRTYRHVNRYRQILTVLIKYGFEGLIDTLRIGQYIEIGLQLVSREARQARAQREQIERLTLPERVRRMLEELGPTFVKLGQVLSTRPDLVPHAFAVEFSRLQQDVPPFPVKRARAIIESELAAPLDELFTRFDEQPIAAASIAQVHRAQLADGEEVVVKVQRPDIEDRIEADLEILLHLATLAERHLEDWEAWHPTRIVQEFSRVIERELDFSAEAMHIERFARDYHTDDTIYVPKVYRRFSTDKVLTLEYLDVIPVNDRDRVLARGLDPQLLARRGTELTLKQIFVHGFFHADPHPGNVFALPGNVVCLLDFGMMGRIDRTTRETFADLLYAVAQRDAALATSALLRLTIHADEVDLDVRRIETDVDQFITLNIPATLGDLDFGKLVHELIEMVHRHRLIIPPDLVMMLKAAVTAEQLVSRLDPELNIIEFARPHIRRLKIDRWRPRRLLREVFDSGGELMQLAREIPGGVRDLLRLSKRGRLRIGFEHRGLENLVEAHERVANRLTFAIVCAALIVGSSLIVLSRIPPTWYEIPVIGLVGYLVAGAMGFMLLISILRHGRL
jgi:ubiquinone biosynthesis protein